MHISRILTLVFGSMCLVGTSVTAPALAASNTPAPPEAPTGLQVVPHGPIPPQDWSVKWTDNSNNELGFQIWYRLIARDNSEIALGVATYRSTRAGSRATNRVVNFARVGVTDGFLTELDGVQACYQVWAFNRSGQSDHTAIECATIQGPPLPPTNVTAVWVNPVVAKVTWTDNTNNESNYVLDVEGKTWDAGSQVWTRVVTLPPGEGVGKTMSWLWTDIPPTPDPGTGVVLFTVGSSNTWGDRNTIVSAGPRPGDP